MMEIKDVTDTAPFLHEKDTNDDLLSSVRSRHCSAPSSLKQKKIFRLKFLKYQHLLF